jgi:hypothetical protein
MLIPKIVYCRLHIDNTKKGGTNEKIVCDYWRKW